MLFKRTKMNHSLLTAERIIGCQLFFIEEVQDTTADIKTGKIVTDLAHPGNHLFEKHSSGREHRSINTAITHHLNTIFLKRPHLS